MKIIQPRTVKVRYPNPPNAHNWTAIVPAAGRGSRLSYDKPKILYPIAGRPIINWLIDLLEPGCQEIVFVLSPTGVKEVEPVIKQRLGQRYRIAIQAEPKGMADAIYQAVPGLTTPHTLIIWGDQVAIQPQTIDGIMRAQEFNPHTLMTMPIVQRSQPYVHYQVDEAGRFVKVLERREGAVMPEIGESDCGLFVFDTKPLQQLFASELAKGITQSQGTNEWNFLPMLPQFEQGGDSVIGVRLNNIEETVGVNDLQDASRLEKYLLSKLHGRQKR